MAAATIGFFSLGYTATSFAIGPREMARDTNKVWSWVGVAFGTTLLAIGGTHAILNRDDLSGAAIVPAAIALPTGAAALTAGVLGLATSNEPTPALNGALACERGRCRLGVAVPVINEAGASITLAAGRF
jgi:hypothetical protein